VMMVKLYAFMLTKIMMMNMVVRDTRKWKFKSMKGNGKQCHSLLLGVLL
jgi:hypothetical protein